MTSIVAIGYRNLIDAATLNGIGWDASKPLTNLQDRRLWTYARTSGTSADIIIDHGSAKPMGVFALFGTNIGAADTMTVTVGTTSTGTDVYAGSAVSCWPFVPLDGVYDGGHFGCWVVLPADVTARYARIQVSSSAVIRISRPFVGPTWRPTYSPSYRGFVEGWAEPNSTVITGDSGADTVWQRREQREVAYDLSVLTPESASELDEIVRTHSITEEVAHVRHVHDREVQQQYGFLGRLRRLSALEHPFYGHGSAAVAITGRGGAA